MLRDGGLDAEDGRRWRERMKKRVSVIYGPVRIKKSACSGAEAYGFRTAARVIATRIVRCGSSSISFTSSALLFKKNFN